MDGLQIVIYIALAIVYFVFKGLNKASQANKPSAGTGSPLDAEQPADAPSPKRGPANFEELLQEIEQRVTGERATQKAEEAGKSVRDLADKKYQEGKREVEAKSRQLDKTIAQERKRLTIEETDDEAQSLEKYVPQYKSLNEVNYEDPTQAEYAGLDDHQKHFAPFDPTKLAANPYAALLRNPESARTAFILSEIVKRKY